MHSNRDEHFKTALQIVGIVCLLGLFAVIFHKAFADISVAVALGEKGVSHKTQHPDAFTRDGLGAAAQMRGRIAAKLTGRVLLDLRQQRWTCSGPH